MGIIRLNQLPVATGTTSDDYILIMDDPLGSGITKVVPVSGLSIAGGGGGGSSSIVGNGTTNYITKWSSTSGIANSILFDNGTRVGLNTTTPSGQLHVVGSGLFSNRVGINTNTPSHQLQVAGTGRLENLLVNSSAPFDLPGGTPGVNIANATINGPLLCAATPYALLVSGAIVAFDNNSQTWPELVTGSFGWTDNDNVYRELTFNNGLLVSTVGWN